MTTTTSKNTSASKGNAPRDAVAPENSPALKSTRLSHKTEGILTPEELAQLTMNPIANSLQRPHLAELRESIKKTGRVFTPVILHRAPDGNRQLLAGVSRVTVCLELCLSCPYVEIDLDKDVHPDEWVAQEYDASKHHRNLTSEQQALDAARICRDVYEEPARLRMKSGKRTKEGEAGSAAGRAAQDTGVPENAIKNARKILDTSVEPLVSAGELKLTPAAKYATLADDEKTFVDQAVEKNDLEAVKEILSGRKVATDALGQAIPSRLIAVAEKAKGIPKNAKLLETVAESLTQIVDHEAGRIVREQINPKQLVMLSEVLRSSAFHCVCPFCLDTPVDDCGKCQNHRWLTKKEYYSHISEAQQLLSGAR